MRFTLTSAIIFVSCFIAASSATEHVTVEKRVSLSLPDLDKLHITSLTAGGDDDQLAGLTDSLIDTEAKKKRSLKTKRGILAIDKLLSDLPVVGSSKQVQPQQVNTAEASDDTTYQAEAQDTNEDVDADVVEDNEEEQAQEATEQVPEAQSKKNVQPQGSLIGQLIGIDVLDGLSAKPAEKPSESPETTI